MDEIGKPVVFNISVLGAVAAIRPVVKSESIMSVLKTRLPMDLVKLNQKALEIGYELAANGLGH